jgi:hypothetical protein
MELNDNIIKFKIEPHSPEWFQFRTTGMKDYEGGVGSSEIGKVCGYDQYPPVLAELYHHKIGTYSPELIDNEATHHGKYLEEYVAMNWQHYQGTTESYIKGYNRWMKAGKPDDLLFRKCHPVLAYLVNVDIPWIFVSCDYIIDAGSKSLRTGKVLGKPCPLEIKTMSGMQAQMWEEGMPRKYIYQVHSQMMVLGVDYGEIAVLIDGRNLKVYSFHRNDKICDEILTKTRDFWFKHVRPGRKYYQELLKYQSTGESLGIQQSLEMIDRYEPGPDNTKEYEAWLKKKYHDDFKKPLRVKGDFSFYNLAKEIQVLNSIGKEIDYKIQHRRNILLNQMISTGVGEVYWGEEDKVKITTDQKLRVDLNIDREVIKSGVKALDVKKYF